MSGQPGIAPIQSYSEAIQYLYGLQARGAKLGLETTRQLAALAGDPQHRLRFIHVAGTNGKGSVCALLESVYRTTGLRVGLYTSPHLVAFGERIQIDRQIIPPADLVRLTAEMPSLIALLPAGVQPTLFEVVTVLALRYFAEQHCDLVIWETGLGGRLDATNIVTPLASVITNIQFDHQVWLGTSLEQIAREKGGIIKPGVPVITATEEAAARAVLEQMARERGAPFFTIRTDQVEAALPAGLILPLAGAHQRLNAALVCATVQALAPAITVSESMLRTGLATARWAGRLQLVERGQGRQVLLDGAHNAAGAATLRSAIIANYDRRLPGLVLGILQDKDFEPMCRLLAPLAERVFLVPVNSPRRARPADLAPSCRLANPTAEIVECGDLAEALDRTAALPLVLVAGSLQLVGEALEQLGEFPPPPIGERNLNEWTATPTKNEKPIG